MKTEENKQTVRKLDVIKFIIDEPKTIVNRLRIRRNDKFILYCTRNKHKIKF